MILYNIINLILNLILKEFNIDSKRMIVIIIDI